MGTVARETAITKFRKPERVSDGNRCWVVIGVEMAVRLAASRFLRGHESPLRHSAAAVIVRSMSASVWQREKKSASYWLHGK